MGIAGTQVAREASDIILLDDSFRIDHKCGVVGTVALREHPAVRPLPAHDQTSRACILVFLATLLGNPAPFTIIQILWINIIMDTLAAFALCSEAPHAGLMNRSPIPLCEYHHPVHWNIDSRNGCVLYSWGHPPDYYGFDSAAPPLLNLTLSSLQHSSLQRSGMASTAGHGRGDAAVFPGLPDIFCCHGCDYTRPDLHHPVWRGDL